jgi:hypothetical protein
MMFFKLSSIKDYLITYKEILLGKLICKPNLVDFTIGGVDFEKKFISKLYHFAIVVSMGRES